MARSGKGFRERVNDTPSGFFRSMELLASKTNKYSTDPFNSLLEQSMDGNVSKSIRFWTTRTRPGNIL
jgi:hypothetical protein